MKTLVFLLALFLPSVSLACSCVSIDGTDEDKAKYYFNNAEAVFYGEAIKVEPTTVPQTVTLTPSSDQHLGKMRDEETTFKVLKSYKGNLGKYVQTKIATECCVCGLAFLKGEKYFLYLYKDKNGNYSTSICSRPKIGEDAMKESMLVETIAANQAPKPTQ